MSAGKGVVPTGSAAIINPGHVLHGDPDPGAVNPGTGMRESDVAANIGDLAVNYLARAVQQRLVRNLQAVDEGNRDRGLVERPGLAVLRGTDMPEDAQLLTDYPDAFARAIACGVTDYQLGAIRRGVRG